MQIICQSTRKLEPSLCKTYNTARKIESTLNLFEIFKTILDYFDYLVKKTEKNNVTGFSTKLLNSYAAISFVSNSKHSC